MSTSGGKKKGLGRGLSALLADVEDTPSESQPRSSKAAEQTIPLDKIKANPDQPRRRFSDAELGELADSIAAKGIIQPLILRPDPSGDGTYQIVAGERRWRAAQKAQLHDVPAVVRELDDDEVLELAIIENIQRQDLNPVEEAMGYQQLMEKFGHTQAKLSDALGKSRSYIANFLRLLSLPEDILNMVQDGKLSTGHARALVTHDDPLPVAKQIVKEGLSVRQTEELMKSGKVEGGKAASKQSTEKDADTRALEDDLSAGLGIRVEIKHNERGGGAVQLKYKSLDDLDKICQLLSR
jgi:ParB family chromosome partitioning protein